MKPAKPARVRLAVAIGAALACAAWPVPDARAQALTTSSVNVRAGPDRFFPAATWVLSGTAAEIHGCVESFRWCDVTVGRDRGWVYARYLSVTRDGRKATIAQGGPALGIPVVGFDVAGYWNAHYADRRWFSQAPRYQQQWERRPPQSAWSAPRSAK